MLAAVLALAALVLAAVWGPLAAALLGVIAGLLWRGLKDVNRRLAALAREHDSLRSRLDAAQRELLAFRNAPDMSERAAPRAVTPIATAVADVVDEEPPAPAWSSTASNAPGLESVAAASRWFVEFFTTGNIVAKVGMIVVFFGVAFLLRYAAERGMLPIEYRLMSTALGASVLLAIGWRLRSARPEYAVVLQGGAIGVLYLTIFAAFRLYGLLPATPTFALLLLVVAFSAVLAVVQGAMSLAILGTSGGFLAPILAATGGGSHVALFAYYAVLNLGVVGIAWFRAWRFLNWLAFVFTFGIGLVWGAQYYRPEYFASTEPFLVLFFLLFLTVAVLFAHRQPPQLGGYIDGSLVFGTPAIAFGLQSALVRDIPFGRAYSAVALAALYLVLARVMMRRGSALRPLGEAFLALAAVFLILAVPLAFDGHATAAAWALEGTGLVWIGIRQQRWLARLVGSALLLGAGWAFAAMASPVAMRLAVLNSQFLGGVAIAAGSIVAGRMLSRGGDSLKPWERPLEVVLLAWGLAWWLGIATVEIGSHGPERRFVASMVLLLAASAIGFAIVARTWNWRAMMHATVVFSPLSWLFVLLQLALDFDGGPLANLGWLAWPAALASSWLLLVWFESVWPSLLLKTWHAVTAWLLMFLTTWAVALAVERRVPEARTWADTTWCLIPVLFVLALLGPARLLSWPVQRFPVLYRAVIPIVPVTASLVWVIVAFGQDGNPAPLPYVPLLNPLELMQVFALVVAYAWWSTNARVVEMEETSRTLLGAVPMAIAFVAINVVVGRVVHFYVGVPFRPDDLARSAVFQTGISILWGVVAGVLMTWSRRRRDRTVWIVGAGLLAVLITKLFLVDLGNVGGIARIVSFLATGILILLIGYFAPAPPRSPRQETEPVA